MTRPVTTTLALLFALVLAAPALAPSATETTTARVDRARPKPLTAPCRFPRMGRSG